MCGFDLFYCETFLKFLIYIYNSNMSETKFIPYNIKLEFSEVENMSSTKTDFTHTVTPSNPTVGKISVYAKNDDKLYTLTSAGAETELGGNPFDQNVNTTDDVQFNSVNAGSYSEVGVPLETIKIVETSNLVAGTGVAPVIVTGATNNIVIGEGAGPILSTGDDCIFIGKGSGNKTTNGLGNIGIGSGSTNAGFYTTFVGHQSGGFNSGGSSSNNNSSGLGYQCLNNLNSGSDCTAVGYRAGYVNGGGDSNCYFGSGAGLTQGAGNGCLFIGKGADTNLANSKYRIALGNDAVCDLDNHMVIGSGTLATTVTAIKPGYNADVSGGCDLGSTSNKFKDAYLYGTVDAGSYSEGGVEIETIKKIATGNLVAGDGAGALLSSGSSNILIGDGSGAAITTSNNNVCIGVGAGALATGNHNVCIGTNSLCSAGVSFGVAIGYNARCTTSHHVVFGEDISYNTPACIRSGCPSYTDLGATNFKFKNAHFSGVIDTGSIVVDTSTPASATATGTAGTITWDADYIYVCTATDTWKRVGISTW